MGRPRMSWGERNDVWRRWRAGATLVDIARALAGERTGLSKIINDAGGIVPPPRRRSRLALTLAEREEISRGLARGASLRQIAAQLRRAPPEGVPAGDAASTASCRRRETGAPVVANADRGLGSHELSE